MAPELALELAKYILITAVAAIGLFLAEQIPLIRVTLSQVWSISIFNFLLIVLLAAVSSSMLTHIRLRKRLISLKLSADTDAVTGVYSNNILKPNLEKEIENAKKDKKVLSIILIDIDGFKRINDTYGYTKANSVLREFAQTLKEDIRGSTDVLLRYQHGDEFLIIAPGTEGDKARIFAERLRNTIINHQFQIDDTYESLTMSAGIAELNNENETLSDFLRRVEEALLDYAKKKYLFIWDEVPGNDSGRVIEFLKENFRIDWVERAKIEKIDEGRTIKVSTGNNSLLLILNNNKNEVSLKIDDVRTDEFIANMKNGKLNIYKKQKNCTYLIRKI